MHAERLEIPNSYDCARECRRKRTQSMITLFTGYDEEPKDKNACRIRRGGAGRRAAGVCSRMRQAVTRTRQSRRPA